MQRADLVLKLRDDQLMRAAHLIETGHYSRGGGLNPGTNLVDVVAFRGRLQAPEFPPELLLMVRAARRDTFGEQSHGFRSSLLFLPQSREGFLRLIAIIAQLAAQ